MTEPAPKVTPEQWVDTFLAMTRADQLLVAQGVDTALDQAIFCLRAHRETAPAAALSTDERAACLRAFSTMADAVDDVLRNEADAEGRRDALRLFKTACAAGIDVLTQTESESEDL